MIDLRFLFLKSYQVKYDMYNLKMSDFNCMFHTNSILYINKLFCISNLLKRNNVYKKYFGNFQLKNNYISVHMCFYKCVTYGVICLYIIEMKMCLICYIFL